MSAVVLRLFPDATVRRVLSWADQWSNYPDLRGEPRLVDSDEWGNNQFGYAKWYLEHLPKGPGATREGYNNWWVYVANTDEDLPEYVPATSPEMVLPHGLAEPGAVGAK